MHSPFSDLCQRSILPFDCGENGEALTCVIPEIRMNSSKSLAMNCGPLSELIRGFASGYCSLAQARRHFQPASRLRCNIMQQVAACFASLSLPRPQHHAPGLKRRTEMHNPPAAKNHGHTSRKFSSAPHPSDNKSCYLHSPRFTLKIRIPPIV